MVIGLNRFRQHFAPYANQYVLIGGTACTVIMQESGLDFRATKDLDIVLYVEALNLEFAFAFWKFIDEGRYQNRQHSSRSEKKASDLKVIKKLAAELKLLNLMSVQAPHRIHL